jgi:DNA gyrase subunit A
VKGIRLSKDDALVGMVVADPDETLLTACANGYGKRTPFGPNVLHQDEAPGGEGAPDDEDGIVNSEIDGGEATPIEDTDIDEGEETSSGFRYRTQGRGGKGVRDIKTTSRNGPVIGITVVHDDDELLMMTARGKIQRIKASDVSVIGRNTQGVRIMSIDEDDSLAAIVRVPLEENGADGDVDAVAPADELPQEQPGEDEATSTSDED